MKKIFLIAFAIASIMTSCRKTNDIVSNSSQVGISSVTYFVDISLNGDEVVAVQQGGTFVDPKATASENGVTVPVTVIGTVDLNTPGLYELTYSATNKDGFSKTVSRTVVVTSGPEVPGTDMTGSYAGPAGLIASVTKVGNGVYFMDNCNHPLTAFSGVFVCLDGLAIKFYPQTTFLGKMYSTSGTYTPSTKKGVWTLTVPSAGYTRTRTFTRL